MLNEEEINSQQELLAAHRRTLAYLIQQAALYGGVILAPPSVRNSIYEARSNIMHVKEILRVNGVSIDDYPGEQQDSVTTLDVLSNSQLSQNSPIPSHRLRIFLCHSSGDKAAVRNLYARLRQDGFEPWLDEENLLAGQVWEQEIRNVVLEADVVIACLSRSSITKRGFVQEEIEFALNVAERQHEGTIFIIPLRLEECEVPERLRRWQWVNYFETRGYEQLLRALGKPDKAFSTVSRSPQSDHTQEKPANTPPLFIKTPHDNHRPEGSIAHLSAGLPEQARPPLVNTPPLHWLQHVLLKLSAIDVKQIIPLIIVVFILLTIVAGVLILPSIAAQWMRMFETEPLVALITQVPTQLRPIPPLTAEPPTAIPSLTPAIALATTTSSEHPTSAPQPTPTKKPVPIRTPTPVPTSTSTVDPSGGEYVIQGMNYAKQGRYDLAIAEYNKAITENPNNHVAFTKRGDASNDVNHPDDAIADYNTALALQPNHPDAVIGLSTAHIRKGIIYKTSQDYQHAIQEFTKSIEIKPSYRGYEERISAYSSIFRCDLAVSDYNMAISIEPNHPQDYLNFAYCLDFYLHNNTAAIENYKKFLAFGPIDDLNEARDFVEKRVKELERTP